MSVVVSTVLHLQVFCAQFLEMMRRRQSGLVWLEKPAHNNIRKDIKTEAMTRRESVNGVLPSRLVCPWWATGVDSGCQEKAGSDLGPVGNLGKEETEQGTEGKGAPVDLHPFMSDKPEEKSVVLKQKPCLE